MSRWAQFNHKDPYKGKREAGDAESEEEMGQQKQRFKTGNHKQRMWTASKRWKKQGTDSLTELQKEHSSADTVIYTSGGFLISRGLRVPLVLF